MTKGRAKRAKEFCEGWGTRALLLVVGSALLVACDHEAIKECHAQMNSSQQAMLDMDSSQVEEVEKTLVAVEATLEACRKAERSEEVAKVADAQRQLSAQIKALKERQSRKKKPKLSDVELQALEKKGDPTCPKGQQYEHHQNKKLIRCTGPMLIDMKRSQAKEYFERRGYSAHPKGAVIRFELGVQSYDFEYSSEKAQTPPACLTIVAQPGVPWQEIITRATGVHPRKLALGKAVKTRRGAVPLLVEGSSEQYTVKLGKCAATPGQKALKAQD